MRDRPAESITDLADFLRIKIPLLEEGARDVARLKRLASLIDDLHNGRLGAVHCQLCHFFFPPVEDALRIFQHVEVYGRSQYDPPLVQ